MNNLQLVSMLTDTMLRYDIKYKLGTYLNKKSEGYLLSDCLGLIEGIMWGYPEDGSYKSNGVPDLNANGLWNAAEVKGSMASIPEVPGVLVYKSGSPGHVGIYLGEGKVMECTAHVFPSGEGNGIVISQFTDPKGKNYHSWQGWLKYPYIEYKRKEGAGMASFFLPGYQKLSWSGKTIHVYGQKDDHEIGLMATPKYKQLLPIKEIDNDEIHYCKVNCSYFAQKGEEKGQVYGREQGFNRDGRPDQKEWIDVVVTKDNKVHAGDFASWEYLIDSVKLSYSPLAVLIYEGKEVEMLSTGVSKAEFTRLANRTVHMQDDDGRHYFAVTAGEFTGPQMRAFAKTYGMTFCALLDGGGSSQMRADGKSIRETTRALPNVLTFYKKGTEDQLPTQPETPPKQPEIEGDDLMVFEFEVAKASFGGNKYATRETALGKYDTNYPMKVGDEFWIDELVADGDYWIGHMLNGPQAGRWIQLDPVCIKVK